MKFELVEGMGMSMIDINKLCLGCMREKKTAGGACPRCGFDLSAYQSNPRCLPPNTILAGKYLVGRVLGQGGFGITYMGFDLNMETRVAIKEYFPVELVSRDTMSMTGDRVLSLSGEKSRTYQQGLEKYVTEAQNVSRFSDISGVVSVKDFFYENETAYIVMEYIEGESLKDYLAERGGSLPEAEALAILRPVLDALSKVHAAGIIHRDISPDNIMLTFKEEAESDLSSGAAGAAETGKRIGRRIESVKLIDFGAARMTAKNDQKSLTIILKHGYAPEEQYRTHGEQGPWTDVYAISAVLYRMMTGETPVSAMDRMFQDSLKGFDEFPVKVSKGTAGAVIKGLAVKKEDRIQSIAELTGALYEGKTVRKYGGKKSGKTAAAIGAAAACVLVVGLFFALSGKQTGQGTAQGGNEQTVEVQADTSAAENSPGQTETVDLKQEEEDFGEVIVTATPQTSYAVSESHALILQEDGTVTSTGSNVYGQRNLSEWTRIAAVTAGNTFSAGLRENGTVLIAGSLENRDDVERWTNIVEIAAVGNLLYGLTMEGTIVANRRDLEWTGVRTIAGCDSGFCALFEDGHVLSDSIYTATEISGWNDVEHIVTNMNIVVGLKEDGGIVASEKWEDYSDYDWDLDELESFQDLVQISLNERCFAGVTEDGSVQLALVDAQGYENVPDETYWNNLKAILYPWGTYVTHVTGVQQDGTIQEWSPNYGTVALEEMEQLETVRAMNGLDGRSGSSVMGITRDGKLIGQSSNLTLNGDIIAFKKQGVQENFEDMLLTGVQAFEEMAYYIDTYGYVDGYCVLDSDGNIWMRGNDTLGTAYAIVNEEPIDQICVMPSTFETGDASYVVALAGDGQIHLYSVHSEEHEMPEALYEAETWTDVSQAVCCWDRENDRSVILGLRSDGIVVSIDSAGNLSETVNGWTGITGLYAGTHAIGAIREDGTAVFLEDAAEYNYGQYNTYDWTDLTQLAIGLYHTAGLRSDGTVYAVGSNGTGQCEVEDWTDVVYIAAGDSCTLGIQSDGTLLIAGDVGW